MNDVLVVSFSFGETSAYMSYLINQNYKQKYKKIIYIFANTGQENEETLWFGEMCSREFGIDVVWVESVVSPEKGIGIEAKVVNYKTASRNGEPFEAVISKEGIPNMSSPHCSSRLKQKPIEKYLKSIGIKDYDIAIGIRSDEQHRAKIKDNVIYPLLTDFRSDKQDVNAFWEGMRFRLDLEGHEGNCKTCWKKSDKKLWLISIESPERFDFFREMERKYKHVNPKRTKFFRRNRTVEDIFNQSKSLDALVLRKLIGYRDDDNGGCTESCEPFIQEELF